MEQPNETSTILLTRKKAFLFGAIDVEVSFNGSKVALLKNGGSESITIPAGTHTIVILPVGFASMFAASYQMVFVTQARESYSFLIEPDFHGLKISLLSSSESIKKATLESVPSTQTEAVKQEQPLEPNDAKPLEQIDSQDQQIPQEQQEPQDKVQVNFNTMYLDDEHNTLPPNPPAINYQGCLKPFLGFVSVIVILNLFWSYLEPVKKTYTVNCTQNYTDNAAKSLNITFNSGTKVFKRGSLAFPINDISIDSKEYVTFIRYYRNPEPGLYYAVLTINPPGLLDNTTIDYYESREEKGSRIQERSFELSGVTYKASSVVDAMVTNSYEYKCSLPPNFDYKYVRID